MAEPARTEDGKRKRKGANVVVWGLMALLVVGLSGFGVSNFGGGVTRIGSVGDRDISTNAYAQGLQQELAAFGAQVGQTVTMEQALAFGLDARVREQLVIGAALDAEAARIGLSVGDARVAAEVTATDAFQGPGGQFDRETYRFQLDRANLTETDYETSVREDIARSILQGAVISGFAAPAPLTDALYAYVAERRGISLLRLTEADLPAPVPAPTDADLQAHYDANIAEFTRPEAKRISYAALLPEALAETMLVEETALRALYDERIDDYVQPERRLVERLVFADDATATAARARIDAGEPFEALVAERSLTLDDIDLGDVSRADLGAAADAVFALTEPGIAGPAPSDLGPALFRMNAVLTAQEVTFEDARADLRIEAQREAARRAIADRIEGLDDLLAGGAAIEDLASEPGMVLGTIDFNETTTDEMAAYPAFRDAAAAVQSGDFPETVLLADGGVVVLRLDEVVPPAPIPLTEAREAVNESWRADAEITALAARAEQVRTEVEGGVSLGAYGIVSVTPELARDGFVEGVPETFVAEVFAMAEGAVQVVRGPDFVGVARLDMIKPAAADGDVAAALKGALAAQAEQGMAQDAFALFSTALVAEAGLQLDDAAIAAVHAQFP